MYIVGITFVFILLKQRRRGRHGRARRVYCIGSNLIGFDDPSRSHACRLAFAAASHSALFTVPGNTPTRTRTRQYTSHTIHFIHVRASPRVAHRRVVVVVDRRRRTSKHIRHVGGVETHPTGGEKRAERADQLSSTRTARHRRRQLPRPMRPTIVHPSRDDRSISIRSDREISSQLNLAVKGSCVRDRCVISIEHGTRGIESMGRRMSESRRSNDLPRGLGCLSRCRASEGDDDDGDDDDGDGARREWGFPCARPCVRRRERRADGRTID